ncbi:hypothetical protein MJ579_24110 [Klebsiella pneumoniae]|nr:hypothetical protein MJ579_24110 [Klebsiella pneumoniae]
MKNLVDALSHQSAESAMISSIFQPAGCHDIFRVLSRQNDRVIADDFCRRHTGRSPGFSHPGTPATAGAVFTHFGLTLHQTVGSVSHRRRHQHVRFR